MAEYYSAELSQKVKRGFEVSRNKGHFTGGKILFGYKSIGSKAAGFKIVPDECESNIVRKIFEDYTSGKQVMTILDDLKAQGVLHNGKFFKKSTLYNMLKNEKYIGKQLSKVKFTTIFTRKSFKRMCSTLQKKKSIITNTANIQMKTSFY